MDVELDGVKIGDIANAEAVSESTKRSPVDVELDSVKVGNTAETGPVSESTKRSPVEINGVKLGKTAQIGNATITTCSPADAVKEVVDKIEQAASTVKGA